jgi:hypothetical protein
LRPDANQNNREPTPLQSSSSTYPLSAINPPLSCHISCFKTARCYGGPQGP